MSSDHNWKITPSTVKRRLDERQAILRRYLHSNPIFRDKVQRETLRAQILYNILKRLDKLSSKLNQSQNPTVLSRHQKFFQWYEHIFEALFI